MNIKVKGYALPLVKHPDLPTIPIYPHQAAIIDAWNHADSFLMVTKTGSGKTAAVTLPIALNRKKPEDNCALFVYPTNELIRDQERAIYEWLTQRLDLKVQLITPDMASDLSDGSEMEIVRVDAHILEEFCERWNLHSKHGKPNKGLALERLLNAPKPRIVLTNPDILYLIYSLRYSKAQNSIGALQAFQTIVFDEFHLYQGVELAHVLYLIHAAREFGAFRRVVLLSATPHPEVRAWIDKLLTPYEITMQTSTTYPECGNRLVTHDIELSTLRGGRDVVTVAHEKVKELLPELRRIRQARLADSHYVPLVVILNSVAKAIELEQILLDSGLSKEEIVPIRGMSNRAVRRLRAEQLVVIGTSAIEVGIDFQCDYLIFTAGDAAAFMQRLGRLGRHQSGHAFLIGTDRECRAIESLSTSITRTEFEEYIAHTYPEADARAWFVGTSLGAFAALSQAFSVHDRLYHDRDGGPDEAQTKEQIYERLQEMMQGYAARFGITKEVKEALRLYWRWARGNGCKWVGDYLHIDSFRTGLPNRTVYDYSEERRRGKEFAQYELDIGAILERAVNPETRGDVIYVNGLTERHTVRIAQSFRNELDKAGSLLTTSDYPKIMLTRDGKLINPSSEMSKRGRGHLFTFIPKDDVIDMLDWRMDWFDCRDGGHVLAFDGDALLLNEIWKRMKSKAI